MYRPKYFSVNELFHPHLASGGDRMLELIPERILLNLDRLRSSWGSAIYINNKGRKFAGVRPINSKIGAKKSRHKLLYNGVQAFDLIPANGKVSELFYFLEKNYLDYHVERLEALEATKTWVHAEFSMYMPERLHIFLP